MFKLHFFAVKLVAKVPTIFDHVLEFIEFWINRESGLRCENFSIVSEELSIDLVCFCK